MLFNIKTFTLIFKCLLIASSPYIKTPSNQIQNTDHNYTMEQMCDKMSDIKLLRKQYREKGRNLLRHNITSKVRRRLNFKPKETAVDVIDEEKLKINSQRKLPINFQKRLQHIIEERKNRKQSEISNNRGTNENNERKPKTLN
ncbi:hypothetical protein CWI36_0075p0040 [Hamiltosporidium magnivora]|uniref:Uncharacterized protein n=1 Tax=Hamiltosporidium magnivora TaxID=148818 RepID=A0A4Q9LL10_9MICR|nr:hypothetical protein CWI36_0075p0040 [Hamiltosporidium magnivora]